MGRKSRRVKTKVARMPFVARSFEGLPHEGDWVGLREFIQAGHGVVKVRDSDRVVRICSMLPGGGAGLVREDGEILIGLQVAHNYGDVSRDLAFVLERALTADPGPVAMSDPGVGARLQDLIDPDGGFDVRVDNNFFFWVDADDTSDISEPATWTHGGSIELMNSIEQANSEIRVSSKVDGVESAFVSQGEDRTRYLRWVFTDDEDALLTALARLHLAGQDAVAGTRLIGMFRAHGLLVPVWRLEKKVKLPALESELPGLAARIAEALADDGELTPQLRSARQGLATRQVTLR